MQLHPGEFVGQTVEASIPYFRTTTQQTNPSKSFHISSFTQTDKSDGMSSAIVANFRAVRQETANVVSRYPNLYS